MTINSMTFQALDDMIGRLHQENEELKTKLKEMEEEYRKNRMYKQILDNTIKQRDDAVQDAAEYRRETVILRMKLNGEECCRWCEDGQCGIIGNQSCKGDYSCIRNCREI